MVVISASRRTDLPAFYPEQTIKRIRSMLDVEAVVFWSKNPKPILPYLHDMKLGGIPYYFQFTLNNYPEFEHNLPSLDDRIATFEEVASLQGRDFVVWRFDPLIDLGDDALLVGRFEEILERIHEFTTTVVTSFVDEYAKVPRHIRSPSNKKKIISEIVRMSSKYGLSVKMCAEPDEYQGVERSRCIDPSILKKLCVDAENIKDPAQRLYCGCIKSTDIGVYKTCKHDCEYCYAK